jgi:hypothetical protein
MKSIRGWCAAIFLLIILLAGCQDLFKKYELDEQIIETKAPAPTLNDNVWRTGKITQPGETDEFQFYVIDGGRYWLEWMDAKNNGGFIRGIKVEVTQFIDGESNSYLDTNSEDWEEADEKHEYRFWARSSGYITITITGSDPGAFGDYKILCHKSTDEEQQTSEGLLPAPTVDSSSNSIIVKWRAPEKQPYQIVHRKTPDGSFDYYAQIFNTASPKAERQYTFVDYFTDSDTRYMYFIEGGGEYNSSQNFWEQSTETLSSAWVRGAGMPSSATEPIAGDFRVTFDTETGDISFNPPLVIMDPHPDAGAAIGTIDLERDGGSTLHTIYLDDPEELVRVNIFDSLFDEYNSDPDWDLEEILWEFQENTFHINYYPAYRKEVPTENMTIIVYPYVYGELTGDREELRLPQYRAPSNVQLRSISSSSIEISWDSMVNTPHLNSYAVYRASSSSGPWDKDSEYLSVFKTQNSSTFSHSPGYFYRVSARYDDGGESVQIVVKTPLSAPVSVTANAARNSSALRGVRISWSSVAEADAYKVYYATNSGGPYNYLAKVSNTYYEHSDLTLLTAYYYKVRACKGVEESELSTAATWTIGTIPSLNTWYTDSLTSNNTSNQYRFPVMNGVTYSISWDDSFQGTSAGTVDIQVSAEYLGGSSIFTDTDSGYTIPKTFTASTSGYVIITVRPYYIGGSGNFRIMYQ